MRSLACVLLACTGLACTGQIGGRLAPDRVADASPAPANDGAPPHAHDAAAPPGIDGAEADPDAAAQADPDAGTTPPPDSGTSACSTALTLTPISGVAPNALAYPLPSGGVVIAWSTGASIELLLVDGTGVPSGSPFSVAGDGLYGLAASADAYAVLVSRGDILALEVLSLAGTSIADTTLMGGVPHDVTGNEWFGPLIRVARLDWTGTEWSAYASVQRLWPDGIQHYGDTLRTFHADGTPSAVYWSWGCSHSVDVRLTHNAMGLGPVCSSDCYPDKGVFFMHQTTLYLDSSGNCAGSVAQELGGVAPVADGFFAGFISGEGRSSKDPAIVHVGNDLTVGTVRWLSDEAGDQTALHLGRYGDGLIAAWLSGGTGYLLKLDATGAPQGTPEMIAADAIDNAGDFFVFAGGDTGFLSAGRLARLRVCR